MIKLNKPKINQEEIINDCIANMAEDDNGRKFRIKQSKETIINKSIEYDKLAQQGKLWKIIVHDKLAGGATKEDMKQLYTQKFVPQNQGGRKYYDELILLAPNGRCPYCGQKEVRTLDHYLPKASYPTYSVTPYNLVPCCADCNKDKNSSIATSREEETIHPYYDDFNDYVWLKAKLIEAEPITFEFYVEKPNDWDKEKYRRACAHFKKYNLGKIYKPYACERTYALIKHLKRLEIKGGSDAAKEHLSENILEERDIRNNTWPAAMYQAYLDSEWFWNVFLPQFQL